jgi:3-deoxy-D-manno-octulosonic-acid transferase
VADTFGEMGLWYRLAQVALIGGTFGDVEGHSPWEAVHLGTPVLHGPRTANFRGDYAMLDAAGAAVAVQTPDDVTQALDTDLSARAEAARALTEAARRDTEALTDALLARMEARHG